MERMSKPRIRPWFGGWWSCGGGGGVFGFGPTPSAAYADWADFSARLRV